MAYKVVDGKIVLDATDAGPESAGAKALSAKLNKILGGKKVFIDAHQLGRQVADEMAKTVETLGGQRVMDAAQADLTIDNPMYPGWTAPEEGSSARAPYHWLFACVEAQEAVKFDTLAVPYMRTHWRAEARHHPVMVYVSANIARYRTMEDARVTQQRVGEMLRRAGAIVVPKRATADVLLVDRKSTFFNTKIVSEVQKNKRTWQRFGERQWADDSVDAGRMLPLQDIDGNLLDGPGEGVDAPPAEGAAVSAVEAKQGPLPTPKLSQTPKKEAQIFISQPIASGSRQPSAEASPGAAAELARRRADAQEEERRRQREDSFLEEDPSEAVFKRGPGRPTGKPRVDYTPQDDEFLCRYIARFHPDGAWSSRKTFDMMTNREGVYPLIARHPPQSWHERFKKNKMQFSRRVERLKAQGLDDNLQTHDERTEGRHSVQWARDLGEENVRQASSSSRKGKERTSDTAVPPKRKLVEDGSDDDAPLLKKAPPSSSVVRGGAPGRQRLPVSGPSSGRPGMIPTSRPADLPAPPGETAAMDDLPKVAAQEIAEAPLATGDSQQTAVVVGATEIAVATEVAPLAAAEDSATRAAASEIAVAADPGTAADAESSRVKAAPAAPPSVSEPRAEVDIAVPPTDTAEGTTAPPTDAALATAVPPVVVAPEAISGVPPDAPTETTAHAPQPSQAPATRPPPEPAAKTIRPSPVADLVERRRAPPSPTSPRFLVRTRASIATVARTRTTSTSDGPPTSSVKRRRVERDTVAASPRIPPPRRTSSSTASDTPEPAAAPPQPPAPPLSREELQRRFEHGRSLVEGVGRTYQEHVQRWLATFDVGHAEIMAAVKEVRRTHDMRQGSAVFAEIERVLQERHGK